MWKDVRSFITPTMTMVLGYQTIFLTLTLFGHRIGLCIRCGMAWTLLQRTIYTIIHSKKNNNCDFLAIISVAIIIVFYYDSA